MLSLSNHKEQLHCYVLGTGKTLVAGALASEINKEGIGKVSFFQRKGADILDKWVGQSEKNLRLLFEKVFEFFSRVHINTFYKQKKTHWLTTKDVNNEIDNSAFYSVSFLQQRLQIRLY